VYQACQIMFIFLASRAYNVRSLFEKFFLEHHLFISWSTNKTGHAERSR
jgi:hypothetical protein